MDRARREKLPQRMRRTIRNRRMLAPGDRVLVAVSGGADSVALLAVLHEHATRLGITLTCGHFNHRLRGGDADADEEFVAALCERLGVPFHSARAARPLTGAGIEARARRERYFFLRSLAALEGASRIATAHTLDDQAETVLMRLLRGSGADGLRAIRPVRGLVVRPLLECPRSAVLDYLAARGLSFRIDASNADISFLRNRVRHEVLPLLTAINPRVRESLARTAATAASDAAELDRRARRLFERCREGDSLLATETARLTESLRSRVLRLWLRRRGVPQTEHAHVAAVTGLLLGRSHGAISLPGGLQAHIERAATQGAALLRLDAAAAATAETYGTVEWALDDGDVFDLPGGWHVEVNRRPVQPADRGPQSPDTLVADAAQVAGNLWLRTPQRGDRMRLHGLGGSRKLQDLFVDRRIPRQRRARWPVVGSGAAVVWLPGVGRSEQALVSAGTTEVWHVQVRETVVAGPGSLCYVPHGSID